ncbi:hypothetical protein B296_00036300 [Ensete ventricosum]|uniref:Uncharacterized protein n=1 Tax=Ensete ventricosum TaxID=4639 RepID=A0A426X5J6_ENSVE|nr:hypothetical protein B296_00036300 [Ensete ventricosum]
MGATPIGATYARKRSTCGRRAHKHHPYRRASLTGWSRIVAPMAYRNLIAPCKELATGGHPCTRSGHLCKGLGHGRPPL